MMKSRFVAALFCTASVVFLLIKGQTYTWVAFPESFEHYIEVVLEVPDKPRCAELCYIHNCMAFRYLTGITTTCWLYSSAYRDTTFMTGERLYDLLRHQTFRNISAGESRTLDISNFTLDAVVHFRATLLDRPHFHVDFPAANDDVAFHMDFRRNYSGETNTLVLSNRVNGMWQNSQRINYTIEAHQTFDVYVLVTRFRFTVLLDRRHIYEFTRHVPFDDIHTVVSHENAVFHEFSA